MANIHHSFSTKGNNDAMQNKRLNNYLEGLKKKREEEEKRRQEEEDRKAEEARKAEAAKNTATRTTAAGTQAGGASRSFGMLQDKARKNSVLDFAKKAGEQSRKQEAEQSNPIIGNETRKRKTIQLTSGKDVKATPKPKYGENYRTWEADSLGMNPEAKTDWRVKDTKPDYLINKANKEGGSWLGALRGENPEIWRSTQPQAIRNNMNVWLQQVESGAYDEDPDVTMHSTADLQKRQKSLQDTIQAVQSFQNNLNTSVITAPEDSWDPQNFVDDKIRTWTDEGMPLYSVGDYRNITVYGRPEDYEQNKQHYAKQIYADLFGAESLRNHVDENDNLPDDIVKDIEKVMDRTGALMGKEGKTSRWDIDKEISFDSASLKEINDELEARQQYSGMLGDYEAWSAGHSEKLTNFVDLYDPSNYDDSDPVQRMYRMNSFRNGGQAWKEAYDKNVLAEMGGNNWSIYDQYDNIYYVPDAVALAMNDAVNHGDVEEFNALWEGSKYFAANAAKRQFNAAATYMSDEFPVLTMGASGISGVVGDFTSTVAALAYDVGIADPKDYDAWARLLEPTLWKNTVRANVSSNAESEVKKLTGSETAGKLAAGAVNVLGSAEDQLLRRVIGGFMADSAGLMDATQRAKILRDVHLGLMSMDVFTTDFAQTLEETEDPTYATAHGIMQAMNELATETILSLDAVFSDEVDGWKYFRNVFLGETEEEAVGRAIDPITETALNSFYYNFIKKDPVEGRSEWEKKAQELYDSNPAAYTKNGLVDWGACLRDVMANEGAEILQAGLEGGAGGLFDTAFTYHQIQKGNQQAGRNIESAEPVAEGMSNLEYLIQGAGGMRPDSSAYKYANEIQKKLDAGKKVSRKEIGRLAYAAYNESGERIQNIIETSVTNEIYPEMRKRYRSMTPQQAHDAAELVSKAVTHGLDKLTRQERAYLGAHGEAWAMYKSFTTDTQAEEAPSMRAAEETEAQKPPFQLPQGNTERTVEYWNNRNAEQAEEQPEEQPEARRETGRQIPVQTMDERAGSREEYTAETAAARKTKAGSLNDAKTAAEAAEIWRELINEREEEAKNAETPEDYRRLRERNRIDEEAYEQTMARLNGTERKETGRQIPVQTMDERAESRADEQQETTTETTRTERGEAKKSRSFVMPENENRSESIAEIATEEEPEARKEKTGGRDILTEWKEKKEANDKQAEREAAMRQFELEAKSAGTEEAPSMQAEAEEQTEAQEKQPEARKETGRQIPVRTIDERTGRNESRAEETAQAEQTQAEAETETDYSDLRKRAEQKRDEAAQPWVQLRSDIESMMTGKGGQRRVVISRAQRKTREQEAVDNAKVTDPELIMRAKGRRTGSAAETVVDGEYATVDRYENGVYHVTYTAEDGSTRTGTATYADIAPINPAMAGVMEYVEENSGTMTNGHANLLLAGVRSGTVVNVPRYIQEARDARIAGYMSAVTGREYRPQLSMPDNVRDLFWDDARSEYDRDEAGRVTGKGGLKPGEGHVTLNGIEMTDAGKWNAALESLDAVQREQVEALADIAQKTGLSMDFNTGDDPDIFGTYEKDKVWLNLGGKDASGNTHHLFVSAGHELTHWLEENSREGYAALRRFIYNHLADKGADPVYEVGRMWERYNAGVSKDGKGISLKDAVAEIVANGADQVLTNEELIKKIAEDDKGLYNKIRDWVKNLISKLRSARKNMGSSANRYSRAMQDVEFELAEKWGIAYKEALDNAQRAQAEETEKEAPATMLDEAVESPTKKFSMNDPVEVREDGLLAVHNLSEEQLMKTIRLGGFPMPSIAVVKNDYAHNRYGDVSVMFYPSTIDPRADRQNKVYSGDAWTPTYPEVSYKLNEKVYDRIKKKLNKLVPDSISRVFPYAATDEDNMQRILDSHSGDPTETYGREMYFKYAYLRDAGNDEYSFPMKEKNLSSRYGNDKVIAVANMMGYGDVVEAHEDTSKYYDEHPEIEKKIINLLNDMWLNSLPEEKQEVYRTKKLRPYDKFGFAGFDTIINGAYNFLMNGIEQEVDRNALVELMDKKISEIGKEKYDAWLKNLFEGIVEKTGIRNNRDIFTPSGNRRSWDALHDAETVENVVRAMKGKEAKGSAAIWTPSEVLAVGTKDFGSLKEIREHADQLKHISDEEMSAAKTDIVERVNELLDEVVKNKTDNPFIDRDNALSTIAEAMREGKTLQGIERTLRKYGDLNVKEDTAKKIAQIMFDIAHLPTEYFEAKPQRAVGLDEIAMVIVPEGIGSELISMMDENGIPHETYDGTDEDRLEKMNAVEGVKFSYSDDDQLTEQQEKYFKDSEARDENGKLMKLYHGTTHFGEITKFKRGKTGYLGPAIYLTSEKRVAQRYADEMGPDNGTVYEVYANAKNPLRVSGQDPAKQIMRAIYGNDSAYDRRSAQQTNETHILTAADIKKLQAKGYDSIFWTMPKRSEIEIAVFDSNQIKRTDNMNPTSDQDIRYSVSDREYMDAVNSGDMEKAQRMVDQAAKEAFPNSVLIQDGKFRKMWHHTNADFTNFLPGTSPSSGGLKGIYFTPQEHSSMSNLGKYHKAFYLDVENLKFAFGVEQDRQYAADLRKRQEGVTDREEIAKINKEYREETGIDAFFDWQNGWYNVLAPELIKSADPVTYDDDGKVIPLSERFNKEKKDIRFSLSLPVETARTDKGELVAVHNLTPEKLFKVLSLKGFPIPSIAVVEKKGGWNKFGNISILFDRYAVDPSVNPKARLYGGDAWTPTLRFARDMKEEKILPYLRSQEESAKFSQFGVIQTEDLIPFQQLSSIDQAKKLRGRLGANSHKENGKEAYQEKNYDMFETDEEIRDRILGQNEKDYYEKDTPFAEWKGDLEDGFMALSWETNRSIDRALIATKNELNKSSDWQSEYNEEEILEIFNKHLLKNLTKYYGEETAKTFNSLIEDDAYLLKMFYKDMDDIGLDYMQEAKPDEMLSFDHAKAAFIPSGLDADVRNRIVSELMKKGIDTIEYGKGDTDRLRALNYFVDEYEKTEHDLADAVSFSILDEDPAMTYMLNMDESQAATQEEARMITSFKMNSDYVRATEEKIRQMNEQLKTAEGDERLRLKNNLVTENQKLKRGTEALDKIVKSDTYQRLMARTQQITDRFLLGKTQDEVTDAVHEMREAVDWLNNSLKGLQKNIDQLAEDENVKTVRRFFREAQLKRLAKQLKDNSMSRTRTGEIENALARTALKMLIGDTSYSEDMKDLARRLIDTPDDSWLPEDSAMDWLSGRHFVINEAQMKELKSKYKTRKELTDVLAGTGITFQVGENGKGTMDNDWKTLEEHVPQLSGVSSSGQALAIVEYIAGKKEAQRQMMRKGEGRTEDQLLMDVVEACATLSGTLGEAAAEKAADAVAGKPGALVRTMVDQMKQAQEKAGELKASSTEIVRANSRMGRSVEKTIKYFDALAERERTQMTAEERQQIIRQLENKAARTVLEEQEKWRGLIEKDRQARKLRADADKTARQARTLGKRLNKLIVNETDEKNVPEGFKSIVLTALRPLVENDSKPYSTKFLANDAKSAEENARIHGVLQRMIGEDLDLSAIDDEETQDAVLMALNSIREGMEEFNKARGKRDANGIQAQKDAAEKIRSGLETVNNIVQSQRSIFRDGKYIEVADAAYEVYEEAMKKEARGELIGSVGSKLSGASRAVFWGNMTPVYFFDGLNNNGMSLLYKDGAEGENKVGLLADEYREKVAKIAEKHHYSEWDQEKKTTVHLKSGDVSLTAGQLMSLYATMKREMTIGLNESHHLSKGGFVFEEDADKGVMIGRKVLEQKAHRMGDEELGAVIEAMTEDQRELADEMVELLSTDLSELGNETSMKLYGIKKYTESYYFPFMVWSGVKNKASNSGGNMLSPTQQNRIAHQGWSKRRVNQASNAVMLQDFMDVCVQHINEVINYNSMAPAIENMNKVLNYQVTENAEDPENATKRNIEAVLTERYGKNAMNYLRTWMQDVNGGVTEDSRRTLKEKALSLFRKNAVAGSLSVALQQPLSYIRAANMISPKYLAAALNPATIKGAREEMLTHSGVAVIKEMGKFDMNYGRTIKEYMMPDRKVGKGRAAYDWISEKSTALPELMDKVTWSRMWTACRLETQAKNPQLKGEELMKKTAERFNDLMRHTQVYDSVMVRSSNMRSKSYAMKTLTSFMAEPTLTLNLMADAIRHIKEPGGKKKLIGSLMTFILAAIAQAAVKGITGAGRTPDEKKTMAENFQYKFMYNFIGEVNPLSLIPGYGDMVDLLSGNEINDDALGVLGKIADAVVRTMTPEQWDKSGMELYRQAEDSIGQIAQIFTGVPAKNLMRDARAMYNWFLSPDYADRGENARATSDAVLRHQWIDVLMTQDLIGAVNARIREIGGDEAGYGTSQAAYYKRIYEARKAGREADAESMSEYLMKGKGVSEKSLKTGIAGQAKKDDTASAKETAEFLYGEGLTEQADYINDQYKEGKLTKAEAEKLYKKYFPKKTAADIHWTLDEIDWKKETGLTTGYSRRRRLVKAVQGKSLQGVRTAAKELLSYSDAKDPKASVKDAVGDEIKKLYMAAKAGSQDEVTYLNMANAALDEAGYTQPEREKYLKNWKKEKAKNKK